MLRLITHAAIVLALATTGSAPESGDAAPYIVVLGVAQDGGVPQAGSKGHAGWSDPTRARRVTCLAVVDPATSQRWLFECTPDFPEQLHALDQIAPATDRPGLDGIFLTHAHIGHYAGLIHLGHEVMGADQVPVYAMPRMRAYLSENGPWDQLVRYDNIALRPLAAGTTIRLNARLSVEPFLVPHRQEYSEVVGYRISGPTRSALFIPDIDSWEEWDAQGMHIEELVAGSDIAYLDATFYDANEMPGRDMSGFPHPFITHTMDRLAGLSEPERQRVRFIHMNHTNPALATDGEARAEILERGYRVADELERVGL